MTFEIGTRVKITAAAIYGETGEITGRDHVGNYSVFLDTWRTTVVVVARHMEAL